MLKRIERKQQEAREFELKIREANAYIQGLQDTLRLLPKDSDELQQEVVLRVGSDLSKAREAILKAKHPLHITDIVKAIGKPNDKRNRLALAGGIARYARKGQIFVKAGPNTFGLAELQQAKNQVLAEPPDDFGSIAEGFDDKPDDKDVPF